ncbi:MAG: hypothetical protein HY847_20180 [Betaproteobacteria bacterium]|nr:hypothetical protein [Betaproteobacteria bacterium]
MLKLLLTLFAMLFSCSSFAGSISFHLSLTGTTLTLTSKGDSSAFYPEVFRLRADGQWERLARTSSAASPAELMPGAQLDLRWPQSLDGRPLESLPPLEQLRPLMVRFFDQAGVSFGQISFMQAPLIANETLTARYMNGELSVSPPRTSDIRATWVIWPQEEGIGPIHRQVVFEHIQPPARRIVWQAGANPLRLSTGAAEPLVMLLHETPQGFKLQTVSRENGAGRQQRTGWLDAQAWLYGAALLAVALALLLPLAQWLQARRGRAAR